MLWTYWIIYISAYFGLFTSIFFLLTYIEKRAKIKDPPLKKFYYVSLVIPCWNEEKVIIKTLKNLINLDYPKNKYEIIVVDDGSTDKTYEKVKKFIKKRKTSVKIKVFKKENGGKGSAMNYGFKKAKGEIVINVDADSYVAKGALKKILGYFEDKKVAAVTSAMSIYKPKGFWLNLQYAEFMLGMYLRKIFDLNNAIHVIPGPLSAYRKSFFEEHGYFDENNPTEDTEIAMRIQAKGYKIKNSISANVYVKQPNNFKGVLKQRLRWYYGFTKNALRYKQLFPPKRWDNLALLILPSAFVSVFLMIAMLFIFLYQNFRFIKDNIIRLVVTNFDIRPYLKLKSNEIIDFISNTIQNPFIAFIIIGIIFTIIALYIAKKHSKSEGNLVLAYIYFVLTYWFLFPFWWIYTFIYKGILRKKIKWGNKFF
jgi:cellulose synthase/poly-beta-1,6-N-acetylglucosamine synthase-like glycosyltransferase